MYRRTVRSEFSMLAASVLAEPQFLGWLGLCSIRASLTKNVQVGEDAAPADVEPAPIVSRRQVFEWAARPNFKKSFVCDIPGHR